MDLSLQHEVAKVIALCHIQVSILVLMDLSLQHFIWMYYLRSSVVSILVLMDLSLQRNMSIRQYWNHNAVSILVLMDLSLQRYVNVLDEVQNWLFQSLF